MSSNAKDEMKLRECPFVLSHRSPDIPSPPIYTRQVSSGFEVVCPRCGTTSPSFVDKERAIEAWNTRTPSPLVEQMYEALKLAQPLIHGYLQAMGGTHADEVIALIDAAIKSYEEAKRNG